MRAYKPSRIKREIKALLNGKTKRKKPFYGTNPQQGAVKERFPPAKHQKTNLKVHSMNSDRQLCANAR